MILNPKIFKEYDIRAEIGVELDEEGARRIAQAFASHFHPKTVGVGHDMRISGEMLSKAVIEELVKMGVNVLDVGVISTDASYFVAGTMDVDYVIQITASHNPPRYNGFKISMRGGEGLDGESGIYPLRDVAVSDQVFAPAAQAGTVTMVPNVMDQFVAYAVGLINKDNIKPFKLLVDAGNGMAGVIIPLLEKHIPLEVTPLYFELDGNFPNHLANPLIEEGQKAAREELLQNPGKYDFCALFDGDGDRMYLMDNLGRFVEGTITTTMVAKQILTAHPGETILYNAICGRVVPETVNGMGGKPIRVRVGHSPIKRKMREHNAIFAGEHSGHYFFRNFFGADSGLVALIYAMEYLSQSGKTLTDAVSEFDKYPGSGEINFSVEDKDGMMKAIAAQHEGTAQSVDWLDGVSIWYPTWWANIRPSNTQPLLRLNVEADNAQELKQHTDELIAFITSNGGVQSFE
jgi:phosphomannomutase